MHQAGKKSKTTSGQVFCGMIILLSEFNVIVRIAGDLISLLKTENAQNYTAMYRYKKCGSNLKERLFAK